MRLLSLTIMFATTVAILPVITVAAPILDQSAPGSTLRANVGASNAVDWSQTFTSGLTGKLTNVEVLVSRQAAVTQPLLFDLRTTASGVPTESDSGTNILGSASIAAASVTLFDFGQPNFGATWINVNLTNFNINVSTGGTFAIVLRSNDPGSSDGETYQWHGSTLNTYALGSDFNRFGTDFWDSEGGDLGFRTFVDVPEPNGIIVFALGSCAFLLHRRSGHTG